MNRSRVLALLVALSVGVGVGACECDGRTEQTSGVLYMHSSDSLIRELMDVVDRYFPPIRREAFEDPDMFERLAAGSPRYKAWRARRDEGWLSLGEFGKVIDALKPELPGYKLRHVTAPVMSCYEAQVWPVDKPELADGVEYTSLVVRVSFLAPVYEMYESRWNVIVPKLKSSRHSYTATRRTHDISPAFQPAAEAFARAIEAHYGYRRVSPQVLDIQLLNRAMWEDGYYRGTMREALFSSYRL